MTTESTHPLKKVCIFGAGAIGGWLGAAVARAGGELSAVARGATLQALREHGLTLVHGVLAFAFNMAVLALSINVVAGTMQ